MSETIVVGYIRTPEGEAAVQAAIIEARRRSGRLVIVHSSKGGDENAATVMADREALAEFAETLSGQGIDVVVEDLARGNTPADDLIEVAEREAAALIVIGLRRRSPIGKLIMGSNAQEVLLNASCQVLAVKAS